VLPAISALTKQTNAATPTSPQGIELKRAVLEELGTCFQKHIVQDNYALATLLDPRFRTTGFTISKSASLVEKINQGLSEMSPEATKFIPVGKYFNFLSWYFLQCQNH